MQRLLAILLTVIFTTGCTIGSGAVVTGAGPDDLLKLRDGPGLNHNIIVGLPDGTQLTRRGCVTTDGRVWCRVFLTDRPSVAGYVSAEYLAHR